MASVAPRTKTIFARLGGVEEPSHALPRRVVRVGGLRAERVHAAMNVGVLLAVVPREPIDHRLRLLRRRRVVQVDERLAVDATAQNRKVRADGVDIRSSSRGGRNGSHDRPSHAAAGSALRELPPHALLRARADRLERQAAQHVGGKSVNQQLPRVRVAQPARAEIEERLIVELTHGRAVRALDVVGENLELRLRVDLRILREQQRAVGLLGVGLLSVRSDDDLAVEDAARAIRQDAFVDLAAAAVRPSVIDRRVVVDEPLRVSDVESVQRALDTLAVQHGDDVVADERTAGTDRVQRARRTALSLHVDGVDVCRFRALVLERVVLERGVLADDDFA